ncbi:TolC family protein [soil metagenome]
MASSVTDILMNKTIYLIFFLFHISSVVHSQDQRRQPWTLQECVEYALNRNIRVMRSQLDLEQSRNLLGQSRAALYPTLNAFGTHSYAFGRTIDPVENRFVEETIQTNQFSLNSEVLIFGGFQNQNQIRQSRVLAEANLAALEQARNDVSINVAGNYLQILLNEELLENARFQLNTSAEQLRRTKALLQAGAVAQAEFLEIRAQYATDELAVVNAENQVELSKLRLMQMLTLPYDPQFEVADPEVVEVDDLQLPATASQVYEDALVTQPIMRSISYRLRSAELGETIARGGRLPTLGAFGNVNTYYTNRLDDFFSFTQQLDNHLGQNLGFRLNIPIFNNLRVRQDIQNAVIQRKNAEINNIETENNLRQEVEQAFLDAKTASKSYFSAQNQVEALQESFRATEQRFNVGAANAVEYNISKNNLNRAESDLIRARYDYIFRVKVLNFYQGKVLSLD